MTREEVQAIIDEVDENRDGRLDYKEVFSFGYIYIIYTFFYTF